MSCSDDDDWYDEPGSPPREGWMLDAGTISTLKMYCVEENVEQHYDHIPDQPTPDIEFSSYSQVELVVRTSSIVMAYEKSPNIDADNIYVGYLKERPSFIIDEYHKLVFPEFACPSFYTAYINGNVTLTCDKVLFGQEPGEDLSQHFRLWQQSGCVPIGRDENAHMLYNFGEEPPIRLSDFFIEDMWLYNHYSITFLDTPEERYDEMTFQLTMPLSREYIYATLITLNYGHHIDLIVTDDVFTAKCTVHFAPGFAN